ncbi:MAG TPA: polysaccharide deacetylase family protein [Methylomirabilota bacterium]|jgi:peptidoglycan/xylan/chitin deacetylase (PgdA/CDA1 family)|nr:polysaccharide deacetylase family protein [Methylomirabilota bacterium]
MTLRTALERVFFSVIEPVLTTAVYIGLLALGRGSRRIPILMYHQVGEPVAGLPATDECVSPARFARQMRALVAAGYRTITLGELGRALREHPGRVPGRCAVVTFDDGLRGQFVEALPVLQRHGLRATFFVIAGSAGGAVGSVHLGFPGDTPEAWQPFGWREARTLARVGMEIGSHTITHRSLGALEPEEVRIEIVRSRDILQTRVGVPVSVFAYPFGSAAYGDVTDTTRELLARAGYVAACTTVVGTNGAGADPLALRRIPIEERDGAFRIRCKLAGAYDWVGAVKSRWQRTVPREAHLRRVAGLTAVAS